LFLLEQMDVGWTRTQLEERALTLRKKRDYPRALAYLRLLVRDPACGEETRWELAATGLKLSKKDLSPEARAADPSLGQFSRLLRNPAFHVLTHLRKATWLDQHDLFYLGFHFSEQDRRDREFGGEVLELLLKRFPRSPVAKDARRKLKSEGLA
jgi:hypothetical protein